MLDRIERAIDVEAPIERVWEIVTQPEHIGLWLGDAGGVAVGEDGIDMTWEQYGTIRLRITSQQPPRRFAFRWGPFGSVEPTEENATLVEFALEPTAGGGTRVTVIESGFRDAERRAANAKGWDSELADLQRYARSVAV